MPLRRATSIYAFTILCGALCAQSVPQPPCGAAPFPSYPDVAAAPAVKVWEHTVWTPAACTAWSPMDSATIVATAARFRFAAGADGLRHKLGAISEMTGLVYWSTSSQKWQPLIVEAHALTSPASEERRKDFAPDEIAAGRILYVRQEDNLLGPAIYKIRILTAAADRLAFATENTTAIRRFGLEIFQATDIQSICFLDRESKDVWRYYNLTRMPKQASVLTMGHDASFINRAVALYRYLAGIPADQEPPAAR